MMKLYIADCHFGHRNALAFDNRPFKTIEEMEEVMVANWNKRVKNCDDIYILGDFCWGKKKEWLELLPKLNGRKHLILGNHDLKDYSAVDGYFVSIKDYDVVYDNLMDKNVVLSHYPIPTYKKNYSKDYVHLYGHVHNSIETNITARVMRELSEYWEKPKYAFNIGVMMPWMNYTPRNLEEIMTNGCM